MTVNIGLYSYGAAGIAFAMLLLLLLLSWRQRAFSRPLAVACGFTALWAASIAYGSVVNYPGIATGQASEVLRSSSWIFTLLVLCSHYFDNNSRSILGYRWLPLFLLVNGLILLLLLARHWLVQSPLLGEELHHQLVLTCHLGLAICGLLLLEQIFRNSQDAERWAIKFLCLGLGLVFAYDFFMYAEALLFRELHPDLWQARGAVNAMAAPLLAVAIIRNRNWNASIQVSRQVVFHTLTLLGVGIYLVAMAAAGYLVKFIGEGWGGILQITFLVAAGALLLVVLFSGRIRARLRVFLSKHFFTYKYDYREQWLGFTRALSGTGDNVPEGIIRSLASIVDSPAGLLWGETRRGSYGLLAHWEMPPPHPGDTLAPLPAWMAETGWLVDLDEYRNAPDTYQSLVLPDWLLAREDAWLLVPLMFRERLQGILLLRRSPLRDNINWEDRDLLKLAGRQAASHLAQHATGEALLEARQFDAFNRLSAYVVHDLKNILAQQSLLLSNAQKHRDNPAFVDDMLNTVEKSVARMQRLMEQMRSGDRNTSSQRVSLPSLLADAVAARAATRPCPTLSNTLGEAFTAADPERLGTVFAHLIQNAQEATPASGSVTLRLEGDGNTALVTVADTGKGMSPEFISKQLFRPFQSTKGLTGMGIGVFESRDYIRQLGGDITVRSRQGKGSEFIVAIPMDEGASTGPAEDVETA